jgi:hypothetical protein
MSTRHTIIYMKLRVCAWKSGIERVKIHALGMMLFNLRSTLGLKYLWAYVVPCVGNLTVQNSLCVQQEIPYGDSGYQPMLKIKFSNFHRLPNDLRSRYSDGLRSERPGFDSRHCKIFLFSTASRPALGPTQPPIQWVRGPLSPGPKAAGAWSWQLTSI